MHANKYFNLIITVHPIFSCNPVRLQTNNVQFKRRKLFSQNNGLICIYNFIEGF